jgi:ATP-dependent DNA helicase RecG
VQAVEEAIAFVQKHSWHGVTINAVSYTVYSQRGAPIWLSIFDDRLEIENPGLLPVDLIVEDLPHGVSRLRNRVIGRVFQALGLIEQWGSGIQRMTAVCRDAGLPPPSFEEIAMRFRVTIPTVPLGPTVGNATEKAILASLKQGQGLAIREFAAIIGLVR